MRVADSILHEQCLRYGESIGEFPLSLVKLENENYFYSQEHPLRPFFSIFVTEIKTKCLHTFTRNLCNSSKKDDVEFNDFARLFRRGSIMYGNYWTMLKSAWKRRNHPNMKILWFEEMKSDMMMGIIRDVANFVGYPISEYKVGSKIKDFS